MATYTGTTGDDIFVGTAQADTFYANGGDDKFYGKGGDDSYVLSFSSSRPPASVLINETNGGDSAGDSISGLPSLGLYSLGELNFTQFKRTGAEGQHLEILTPARPHIFTTPGYTPGTIKIANQYSDTHPDATIETLYAGGIAYNISSADIGTDANDILTGWKTSVTLQGGLGTDYLTGSKSADSLYGGADNDTLFGGNGRDFIDGGEANDYAFGGAGKDRIEGGLGNDILRGEKGRDVLLGGDGDDQLFGGTQGDRLVGGNGKDTLVGGDGDDLLVGGKLGDFYMFSSLTADADRIIDRGESQPVTSVAWYTYLRDSVVIEGYADLDEAIHNIGIEVTGGTLTFTYTSDAMAPGQFGSVTIVDQFDVAKNMVEFLSFGDDIGMNFNISQLSGDNFTYSVHNGGDVGADDVVVGTTGDDEIYGGFGSDIIFGAGGADTFMFHNEEGNGFGHDIILDFDITDDKLDFTDIAGFSMANVTVSENAYGNAVVTSAYCEIELDGVAAIDVSSAIFNFA